MHEGRVYVREATDDEQQRALVEWDRSQPGGSAPRPPGQTGHRQPIAHIELLVLATIAGDVLVTNRSTVELEVVHDDGSSVGLPPTARGCVPSGAVVRTPPGGDWTRPRPVSDVELLVAQRMGMTAYRSAGVDFLWVQRLPDGRALFLQPWSMGGVQLSVGILGEMQFLGTWDYDAEHRDAGWRAALSWDGHGEPDGWSRHPETGRVRPDGTARSEQHEGRR